MKSDLMEQIVALGWEEVQAFGGDLDQAEAAVWDWTRQVGRRLLERLGQEGRHGYSGSRRACPCGGKQRFISHRLKGVLTVFGPVKVRRAYYRCDACGASSLPYDQASGLGDGALSNRLASAVSLLSVDSSFEQASAKVEKLLGVKVDDNTVAGTAERAGAALLSGQDEAIERFQKTGALSEPEASPRRLYLSSDGAMAPIRPGERLEGEPGIDWREVKCAAAWWQDPEQQREQRYLGRIEAAESFGWKWWLLAASCGVRRAEQVVVLGDGAPWIWKLTERFFGRAVQILDWYHAAEHLWSCGHALYGEGSGRAGKWVEQMKTILWERGGRALLDRLRQWHRHRRQASEPLEELIGYVEANVDRMDYPSYRAEGLDIGSGPVESACKQLVTARLKQVGMRWTVPGAERILALRCCWLNGQWDSFWQSRPLAA